MPLSPVQAVRWGMAIPNRHSRRSYDSTPLAAADLDALESVAVTFQPFPASRGVVIRNADPSLFVGIVGAYGGVSGAPAALAFIGRGAAPAEAVGYTGEALVLEATALGLDTCWVGGLFSAGTAGPAADCSSDERVFAVSPLGHAAPHPTVKERVLFGAGRPKHRRRLEEIASGHELWPPWARASAEAARLAPSAMNRQPWRLAYERDALVIGFGGADSPRISKRLDCGIAMLHIEIAAVNAGITGEWELLESPQVARFVAR